MIVFHSPNSMTENSKTRKGSVLLFVLGILALLSLLGSALFLMARQEKENSTRFADSTRAQLAAESGVEYALARLMNYNASLCGLTQVMKTVPNTPSTPLHYLSECSFGNYDLDGNGLKETAGFTSETYAKQGDRYKLRVESAQSKLNINDTNSPMNIDTDPFEDQWTPERDYLAIPEHLRYPTVPGDPSKDKDPDWIYPDQAEYKTEDALVPGKPYPKAQGRLWTIVKELTDILFPDTATPPASPTLGERTATAIFKARKQNLNDRFNGFHEIKDALVPQILNDAQYNLLESHFTLHSWQDENALRPTFQWRINTPPILEDTVGDADGNPREPSAHVRQYPGDWEKSGYFCPPRDYPPSGYEPIERPVQRPGTPRPNDRFASMFNEVAYDYNHDGTINESGLENPHAYNERFHHQNDIYLFSDMQTRYFALECRSPVDVNSANKFLLQAMLKPIQGWYLKEAPSVWEGEESMARAEDWSQPVYGENITGWFCLPMVGSPFSLGVSGFPWHICPRMSSFEFGNWAKGYQWQDDSWRQDEMQYYFYDSYLNSYPIMTGDIQTDHGIKSYISVNHMEKNGRFGELCQTKAISPDLAAEIALKIYEKIHPDSNGDGVIDSFHPFITWEEFENFIIDLGDRDGNNDLSVDFDIYMAHALIAVFNPNTRLNDFNPNKRLFQHVDKSQMSGYSTELCLHPMGPFEIESLGSVYSQKELRVSEYIVKTCANIFEVSRISSQEQFMNGYDISGSNLKIFVNESKGNMPTAGAIFNATGNLNLAENYNGHTIQCYPEPELTDRNLISQSIYDGCLMLSTNQAERGELFAESAANENARNVFLANMNGTLNAQYASGNPFNAEDTETTFWKLDKWRYGHMDFIQYAIFPEPNAQLPTNKPSSFALTKDFSQLTDGSKLEDRPGNLFPDGALSDVGRSLIFDSKNNIGDPGKNGKIGSLQFWMKPNFDVAHSNRIRKFFTAPPRENDTHERPYPVSSIDKEDEAKDFSLLFFSRGGRRVTVDASGRLDDSNYLSYDPNYSLNDGRWLPTRSLFLLAGKYSNLEGRSISGIGSTSANQSWREAEDIQTPGYRQYNFESHQWSLISCAWDWVGSPAANSVRGIPPARYFNLCINGNPVEEDREQHPPFNPNAYAGLPGPGVYYDSLGYFNTYMYSLQYGIQQTNSGKSNFMGFGSSSSALWGNHVADATYDDFVTSIVQRPESALLLEYGYGRYYAENDAVYTSPEFDIQGDLQTNAKALTLFSVSWTGYWPLSPNPNVAPNHPRFNDNLDGTNSDNYNSVNGIIKSDAVYPSDPMSPVNGGLWTGDWIPFSIDIMNPATGKWRYSEENNAAKDLMPNYAGGSMDPDWQANPLRWEKARGDKLRFRVHFNIAEGQTLFTSPIFDDITFIFKMDQPKILYWENN